MTAPVPFPDCTGVLVAGGQATRFGGLATGLLEIGGEPIAARSLRLFRGLFGDVLVGANDPASYAAFGARIVADRVAGKGAPGGLDAALAAATTPWIFTAGCDMPFLSEAPIRFLAARRAGAPAVAVVWRGRLEPLHAVWSRAARDAVERLVRAGDPSMWAIARAIGARFVAEEDWREVDPDGRAFANANAPEDAARLGLLAPG